MIISYFTISDTLLKAKDRLTTMLVMPPGFSKRKVNSTQFFHKINRIHWRLHLVFIIDSKFEPFQLLKPELDGSLEVNIIGSLPLVGITLPSVQEDAVIHDIINLIFLPTTSDTAIQRHALRALRPFQSTFKYFIQKIPSPSLKPSFIEVRYKFPDRPICCYARSFH